MKQINRYQWSSLKVFIYSRRTLLTVLVSALLGACATGPGGSPMVEERSLSKYPQPVQAGPAEVDLVEQEAAVLVSPLPVLGNPVGTDTSEAAQSGLSKLSVGGHISADAQAPLPSAETPVATPVVALPPATQQVVEQLLLQADTAKAKGQPAIAIIKLQQAQRIAPQEPKVYARLAALYLAEGQASRAEQLARKGLTLVAEEPAYGYFFWRLIGACRRYQGDAKGEQEALTSAQQWRQ